MLTANNPAYGLLLLPPNSTIEDKLRSNEAVEEAYSVARLDGHNGYIFRARRFMPELYAELKTTVPEASVTALRVLREFKGRSSEDVSGFAFANLSREEMHSIITIIQDMARAPFVRRTSWICDPENARADLEKNRILGEISGNFAENYEPFREIFIHPRYINLEGGYAVMKKIK
jgi:hypothetical protein